MLIRDHMMRRSLFSAMFKFDFNVDDADDTLEISSTSEIQPLPLDGPSPELEPFAEIHIDQLVRANLSKLSSTEADSAWLCNVLVK